MTNHKSRPVDRAPCDASPQTHLVLQSHLENVTYHVGTLVCFLVSGKHHDQKHLGKRGVYLSFQLTVLHEEKS